VIKLPGVYSIGYGVEIDAAARIFLGCRKDAEQFTVIVNLFADGSAKARPTMRCCSVATLHAYATARNRWGREVGAQVPQPCHSDCSSPLMARVFEA
jgi:hypothetical protein